VGGNDLIYIPGAQSEIIFYDSTLTAQQQWDQFNDFIEQDSYLSSHRGQIAERFGLVNPWYNNVDLKLLQDFAFGRGTRRHAFQLSLDILNVGNFINSDWGVRKVAKATATSPLVLVDHAGPSGEPRFLFNGETTTFIDDPSLSSRWRAQVGLRYFFNY
jgi:hypothetical protein